jgi:preprotein translocase subunit SecB
MPNVVAIKLSYRSDRSKEDARRLVCKLPIETTAAYAEGQEPALLLRATFAVAFQFDDLLPDDTEDEKFRNFIRTMAISHVWPYWRQFVHTTTVSMSLPPMQMFPEIPQEMLNNFVTTP